jgi:integrase
MPSLGYRNLNPHWEELREAEIALQKRKLELNAEKDSEELKVIEKKINGIQKKAKLPDKKIKRAPVICSSCGIAKSYSNFNKHYLTCQANNKKSKIIFEKKQNFEEEIKTLKLRVRELELENEMLKSQIKLSEEDEILTMNQLVESKKTNTKSSYLYHWTKYLDWCSDRKKISHSKNCVLEYFNELCDPLTEKKYKPNTINTIRSILMTGFSNLYDKHISKLLNKKTSTKRNKTKEKYSMSQEELLKFFESLTDIQDFLYYYILLITGCRNHSLAMLTPDDYEDGVLSYKDYKTDQEHSVKIKSDIVTNLFDIYAGKKDRSDFLFYPPYFHRRDNDTRKEMLDKMFEDSEILKKRSKYVSAKIRKQLKESEIFKHVDKKICLGPHMFRKTKAMNAYKFSESRKLEFSRNEINQKQGSSAIFNYVYGDGSPVDIYEELLKKIDDSVVNKQKYFGLMSSDSVLELPEKKESTGMIIENEI